MNTSINLTIMSTIGEVLEIPKQLDIEWKISDFDSLSNEVDKYYSSPVFSFGGASWYLKIYPNGRRADNSVGYIGFCLSRLSSGPPSSLEITLGIKALDGNRDRERQFTCISDELGSRYIPKSFISQYGTPRGISRSKLFERKLELIPLNVLTLLCSLKNFRYIDDSGYIATAECSYCHSLFDAVRISSHENNCPSKPMMCPKCSEVLLLQNWYDHECKTTRTEGQIVTPHYSYSKELRNVTVTSSEDKKSMDKRVKFESCYGIDIAQNIQSHEWQSGKQKGENNASGNSVLYQAEDILQGFKDIFLNEEDSDVVIRVKNKDFPAHKVILKSRSSVFASIFRNDMKVKTTGCLIIEDFEPSIFRDFLYFLYCKDVKCISQANVFSLFSAADKYAVLDLKTMCIGFIKDNLSTDTFCDTVTVALQNSEIELVKLTTDYFVKNAPKIIVTAQWQKFLAENPTHSNELFMKVLVSADKSSKV